MVGSVAFSSCVDLEGMGDIDTYQFISYPTRKTIPGSKLFEFVGDFLVQKLVCTADLHGALAGARMHRCGRQIPQMCIEIVGGRS